MSAHRNRDIGFVSSWFWFHAMRVGEAKLRGLLTIVVLIAEPLGCEDLCVLGVFSHIFRSQAHGFEMFLVYFVPSGSVF